MMQKIIKKILLYQILMILTCLFFVTPTNAVCSGNLLPVEYVGYNFDPHMGVAPLTVHFTAVTESSAPIISYVWEFGDGTPPQTTHSPDISHTYTATGSWTAQLTAVNDCMMSKKASATITVTEPQVYMGLLTVSTNPPGATVYVDGTYEGTTPPVANHQLVTGQHTIKLTLTGYKDYYQDVYIVRDQTYVLNIQLTPLAQPPSTTGFLTVTSNPTGAMVYVDQIYQGTTPLTIPQLATNSHTVRLTLTGYTDYDTTVNVLAEQTSLINHQFIQSQPSQTTGSLQVSTIPSGATIILDGKNKGQTPVTISDLSTGDHTAKLTKSGYWDFSQTVHIDAGQTTPLDVNLVVSSQPTLSQTSAAPTPSQPAVGGSVIITSNPPGANVYLDGKSSGTAPVTLQNVNPGTHTILLTMLGYSDASRTVEVTAGSQNQISVDLIGGKKTPGFEAALAMFSITGLVLFRILYRKEE